MAKPTKKAVDADSLIGEIALVRSPMWQNGNRNVAAIITDATSDPAFLPEGASALVSVTAFAPGAPSRMMTDVPFYSAAPASTLMPAAWLKHRA